jgi:hypothetical protein
MLKVEWNDVNAVLWCWLNHLTSSFIYCVSCCCMSFSFLAHCVFVIKQHVCFVLAICKLYALLGPASVFHVHIYNSLYCFGSTSRIIVVIPFGLKSITYDRGHGCWPRRPFINFPYYYYYYYFLNAGINLATQNSLTKVVVDVIQMS